MSDPITLAVGIGLVAAVAWALVSFGEGQKQIAEGIAHIIGTPTERERKESIKLAQSIREEQAQAQAPYKAVVEQSMQQTQQQIELQQRTVFLLEQILSELKDQNRQRDRGSEPQVVEEVREGRDGAPVERLMPT